MYSLTRKPSGKVLSDGHDYMSDPPDSLVFSVLAKVGHSSRRFLVNGRICYVPFGFPRRVLLTRYSWSQ